MKNDNKLYSTGEFSKLTGVNKRTLHYYNDIGLFRPELIDGNGYHFYTIYQSAKLQMILTLRKIGLSIEEIKSYFENTSDQSLKKILLKQKKLISKSIDELLKIKDFLETKSSRLEFGMEAVDGKIELCKLPKRRIILSPPIINKSEEKYYSVASEFFDRLKKEFKIPESFGSRISANNIKTENYEDYNSFFAYVTDDNIKPDLILEAGNYIRAFSIGSWDYLPVIYKKILTYADKHNLILSDFFYEEGLNDLSIKSEEDYITMITVGVKEN